MWRGWLAARSGQVDVPTAAPAPRRTAGMRLQDRLGNRGALQLLRMRGGGRAASPEAAQSGVAGAGGPLPHRDRIQAAFGPEHDLSMVTAHVGGPAAAASAALGASAYTTGDRVAFGRPPSVEEAAHEAAH